MSVARRKAQWATIAEVRNRLVSVGVCPDCHWRLARPGKVQCYTCARKKVLYQRERRGFSGSRRCGICRRRGHTAPLCRSRKAEP